MLLTRSPYHSGPANRVLDYLLEKEVVKKVTGQRCRLIRDPAPEILHGNPRLVGAYIDALPFKMKYSCWTLSCAPEDADVDQFNLNHSGHRQHISTALRLITELFFAGIPLDARPPWLAATHTHTGRIEVNILLPRAVGLSGEPLRAWNPDPPTTSSRNDIDACIDVLNDTFGWSDPRCPLRRVVISPPSWIQKRQAEARRHGHSQSVACAGKDYVVSAARDAVAASLPCQLDTVKFIENALIGSEWVIRSVSSDGITFGPKSGSGSLITMRGTAMGNRPADRIDPFDAVLCRGKEVKASYARLAEAFQRRHSCNRELGRGAWPPCPTPELEEILQPRNHCSLQQRLSRLIRVVADRLRYAFRYARLLSALTALPPQPITKTASIMDIINDQLTRVLNSFKSDRALDRSPRARARDGGYERDRPSVPTPLRSLTYRTQHGANRGHDGSDCAAYIEPVID